MATVLALETTSEICSVALNFGRNILAESRIAPRRHNELVLKMVDKLLVALEIHRKSIDVLAFSCGPGSFTGVRLGAAVAQGIAMGLDIQVIPVPTSDVMANRVAKCFTQRSEFFLHRRSHKGWAYVARYALAAGSCTCVESDRLVEECRIPENAIGCHDVFFTAEDVIDVAYKRLDRRVPPHLALPKLVDGDSPYTPGAGQSKSDQF
ncbi:MAG: tRNA (adenosine(37)-N6)-threonylcarbamoyltransferase complex dimerization subunit type 1 TsaB [Gammaproteobacteria bacterium]|nr:tRNA (adenosine(37)-N6)-threonylcarbamoyltransferase complex dimerization subunit type 1 TsaB [Gammaproteobacteria bacterium]